MEENATVQYVQAQTGGSGTSLHLNIPTLTADFLYGGAWSQNNGGLLTFYPSYCLTDWNFTDWQGASHAFRGYRDCSSRLGQFGYNTLVTKEAMDDSGYILDFSAWPDVRVAAPDGTMYHFPTYTPPPNNGGQLINQGAQMQLNWYSRGLSSMVDPNGNTITIANGVLTDTVGRQITLAYNGVSWPYQSSPSATPLTASVTRADSSSQSSGTFNTNLVPSCQAKPPVYGSPAAAAGYTGPVVYVPQGNQIPQVHAYYYTTLTLPDSTYYQLTYDSMNRLTTVRYPSGGYTRYDYDLDAGYAGSGQQDEGDMMCTHPRTRVVAKHECTLASGACSHAPQATYSSCQPGSPQEARRQRVIREVS